MGFGHHFLVVLMERVALFWGLGFISVRALFCDGPVARVSLVSGLLDQCGGWLRCFKGARSVFQLF